MGNSGRSSTGCGLCRKRKIKCDEGRPGCRKCAQVGKPCPGYPFSIELQIRPEIEHNANQQPEVNRHNPTATPEFSFALKAGPARPRSMTPFPIPPVSLHPEILNSSAPREHELLECKNEAIEQNQLLLGIPSYREKSISPPPTYDVQHQATCFFLHMFSYQASKLYGIPILDFLPNMLDQSSKNPALQYASKAVSRMTLADRYSGTDARLDSRDEYSKALKSVSEIMSDQQEAIKDEAVTAVWLLGLYEAINSVLMHGRDNGTRDPEAEWKGHIAHMRGAMRLLKLRGKKQFENPRSERIFRIFKAAIQMRLFILNSITSSDFNYLEIDAYKDEHEFVPSETANKASSFFNNAANHMEAAKYAIHKLEVQPQSRDMAAEFDQLIYEGECLDAGMVRWSKQEPGWDMMPVQADLTGTIWALYPFHARYHFYSFWVFLYWLRFLSARIKLYETLIEMIKVKRRVALDNGVDLAKLSHLDVKTQSFIKLIRRTADDLIGLTAYALGDVTNTGHFLSSPSGCNPGGGWYEVNAVAAMQLVVPFKVLLRSPYASAEQRGAIDLAITHIADGFRRQPIIPELRS